MKRSRSEYGVYRKPIEVFELWEAELELAEGTGGTEGRADFPIYMLDQIRNKVTDGWNYAAGQFESYMGRETAEDLRQHTINRLNHIDGIGPVDEYDEYPRMKSHEEVGPSYAVGKHGGVYGITQEALINDTAGRLLNRTPSEIGKAMARYVTSGAVAYIESNPNYIDGTAFFHSSRGNIATGTDATLNEDNVATILTSMQVRRVNGMPIGIEPNRIVVRDKRQELILRRILHSAETQHPANASTATFNKGSKNPLEGFFPDDGIVVEPWLNDADDWYVFANAQDRDAFVVAYLRDNTEPFVGMKNPEVRALMGAGEDPYSFEFDSIDYKIRHFFGFAPNEPFAGFVAKP